MKFTIFLLSGLVMAFLTPYAASPARYSNDIQDPQAFEKSYWSTNEDVKLVRTDRNFEVVKNPDDAILKLNRRLQKEFPKDSNDENSPQIVYQKLEGDTLYVKLENADYVTQRMGSTGAGAFMAEVTFALTEIEGVKYISFDFEEGDHARPGTYSRDSEEFQEFRS